MQRVPGTHSANRIVRNPERTRTPDFLALNAIRIGCDVPADSVVNATSNEFSQHPRMTSGQSGWTSHANAPLPPVARLLKRQ